MLVKFYGIYDREAKHFAGVRPYPDDVSAVRDFELMVNTKDNSNLVNRYPDSFSLWHLFDFDDEQGFPVINTESDTLIKRKVIEAMSLVKDE